MEHRDQCLEYVMSISEPIQSLNSAVTTHSDQADKSSDLSVDICPRVLSPRRALQIILANNISLQPITMDQPLIISNQQSLFQAPPSNVCPCVPRRTLQRDESIVIKISQQAYKVIINMLLSLTIFPYRNHLVIKKRLQLIMLSIVLILPLITASASPPCLIITTGVFVKFGALRERFYKERIQLQVLKMLSEEKSTFRELRRSRRGV